MNTIRSFRSRWLSNALGMIFALGMVCVMLVTALFANHAYRSTLAELHDQAAVMAALHSEYPDVALNRWLHQDSLEIQFLNPADPETAASHYVGKDPATGTRIMAVSQPLMEKNGEVAAVIRLVIPTKTINMQVYGVFAMSFAVLLVILAAIYVSAVCHQRSIMVSVDQITQTAKRIANGSYGTQMHTKYDCELGELAATINELSAKISQNEKLQAEFVSQLSHELRTPLTVINGWSETLLADQSVDSDTRQGMKVISGEAKRLTEMVTELLDFTRMQDGRMTLDVKPTDIRGVFEDTVYLYSSRCAQEGIQLHYEESDVDIPEIPCDGQRLRQVFLNILDNATKHGGQGNRIDGFIGTEEGEVVVRIRDYGPGIAEDEIPLVKKKFYRGSSSVRGTGIGLAVCDEIVELHGGSLTLENAEGGGTLVTVRLPMAH